ncbi:MAG: hypothetical protein JOY51_09050 [Nevskia sp.]|nr:hypothetical protein [Nevskia sp.]
MAAAGAEEPRAPASPSGWLLDRARPLFDHLENAPVGFGYFCLSIVCVINLRTMTEQFTNGTRLNAFDLITYVHFLLFYVTLGMAFALVWYAVTGEDMRKIARVITASGTIFLLPPLIDYAVSLGRGYDISYLLPGVHDDLVARYFTFFGDMSVVIPGAEPVRKEMGITPGIRVETALFMLESYLYCYGKTGRRRRGLAAALLTYTVGFLFAIPPFLIKWLLALAGLPYQLTQARLAYFFALLLFVIGPPIWILTNEEHYQRLTGDLRPARLLHRLAMPLLGLLLGLRFATFAFTAETLARLSCVAVAVICYDLYTVVLEGAGDAAARGDPVPYPEALAWLLAGVAVGYAALVDFNACCLVGLCIGNHYLYAMYPLRLTRVPLLGQLILAVNALFLTLVGFHLLGAGGDAFPRGVVALYLLGGTALLNVTDLAPGGAPDRLTLPRLLGLPAARLLIGLAFIGGYLAAGLLLTRGYWAAALYFVGLLQFYLVHRPRYRAGAIGAAHCAALLLVMGCLYAGAATGSEGLRVGAAAGGAARC